MSLLERIVIAHRCRSTHHYIAMDALSLITGPDAEKWRNLILVHNEELLKGAKAPDAVFKDFKNHVLHIGEGEWGGARDIAMAWYGEAVAYLREKKWAKAVYALGVLSHYYADPIQPFHTGQTEEEGAIHRAVEWSIAKSRTDLKARIDEIGYPEIEAGEGAGFVSDMVRAGAEKSHPHYQTLLDHYNLDLGVKNPPAGLDQTLIDVLAELIAHATAGLGVLFSRAFAEAGVAAPKVHISVPGYLATLDIPIRWITRKLDNAADKRAVTAMYREYKKTGKVIKTLSEDDKKIRKIHARQVLRMPIEALDAQELAPIGTKHEPRPEYVEFAKEIAEELAAGFDEEAEREIEQEVETDTDIDIAAPDEAALAPKPISQELTETSSDVEKPAKSKKSRKSKAKPKVRLAAAMAEKIEPVEATPIAEPVQSEADRAADEVARLETDAKEAAARAEAERLEAEEVARLEEEDAARLEAEAAEEARLEAEAEAEKLRAEEEETARLEAEELARFEAREAAEFARLQAEEAAELERMEAEEAARIAAEEEELACLEAEEADRLAAEAAERAEVEREIAEAEAAGGIEEDEFTLEELAAFDTNLTDSGDGPDTVTAPPVDSFFEAPADGRQTRSGLMAGDPVIDAPSIGKKTARRLNRVGIFTVEDLLNCDSEEIAFELDVRHIDEPTLDEWKAQARLMTDVPGLRVHDAQILVGAGIRTAEDLANASATRIFHASMGFLKTSEGARVVRDDHVLRETEVSEWIDLARDREVA